jgi:hypothetical protein
MRLAPLSGIAAVLLVGVLAESNIATSASDSSITSWLARNHTGGWLAHAFLLGLAAIAVLIFGYAIRDRVAETAESGETSAAGSLISATGVVLAVALFSGAALFAAYPIGHLTEDMPLTSADGYRLTMAASASLMFVFSMLPAAALAVSAATIGFRRRTMPRWLAIFSYVCAALMIASALLVPFLAFGIWIVVTSVTLAVTRPPVAAPHSPVKQSLVTSR